MYEYTSSLAGRRLSGGAYYGRLRLLKLHFRSTWQYPFFSRKELHRHIYSRNSLAVNQSLDLQVIRGQARLLEKLHVSFFHLLFATTLSSYWLILWMEFFLKRANLGCNLVLVLILKNLSSCSSGEPRCLPSSPQSHEQALHGKAQLRAAWLPCGKTRAYPNFPLIFWYTHLERQDVYT